VGDELGLERAAGNRPVDVELLGFGRAAGQHCEDPLPVVHEVRGHLARPHRLPEPLDDRCDLTRSEVVVGIEQRLEHLLGAGQGVHRLLRTASCHGEIISCPAVVTDRAASCAAVRGRR
jgi:hypothetical protein